VACTAHLCKSREVVVGEFVEIDEVNLSMGQDALDKVTDVQPRISARASSAFKTSINFMLAEKAAGRRTARFPR
jgi:hypothetical protein